MGNFVAEEVVSLGDIIVRLQSLDLKNIKNVSFGRIEMPCAHNKELCFQRSEILGLYGQNGSGKTAAVDALYFLQNIMIGKSLKEEMGDYIDANEDQAEIWAEFAVFMEDSVFEVGYRIQIRRTENRQVEILRELLSCAKNSKGRRTSRAVFMDYKRDDRSVVFRPKKRLEEVFETNKEYKTDLIVARKLAEKSRCSYIFGESSREIFFSEHGNAFSEYSAIIKALFHYALTDLFVIRNSHSGVISANFVLPMAFRIDKEDPYNPGLKGDFTISLMEATVLDERQKDVLYQITGQINTVIHTIIPGMRLDIRDHGFQMMGNGKTGFKVELLSKRDGIPPIPIRMESEGIIKIISILNALIQAFGNASICLVIDELDAGIFEYMLGELLDIFHKSARGQLIFTSHNLRALEMLKKDSIMFSTANPNNRYIHMRNMKASDNLRDAYLRSITLGGQIEEIYSETDSFKIARAFRKAGRSMKHTGGEMKHGK